MRLAVGAAEAAVGAAAVAVVAAAAAAAAAAVAAAMLAPVPAGAQSGPVGLWVVGDCAVANADDHSGVSSAGYRTAPLSALLAAPAVAAVAAAVGSEEGTDSVASVEDVAWTGCVAGPGFALVAWPAKSGWTPTYY